MVTRITGDLTLAESIELYRNLRSSRLAGWLVTAVGVAFSYFALWAFLLEDRGSYALMAMGAIFLCTGFFTPELAGLATWTWRFYPAVLNVDRQGVHVASGTDKVCMDWGFFTRWFETKNLAVFIVGEWTLAIARRGYSESEWAELMEVIRAAMGKPPRW